MPFHYRADSSCCTRNAASSAASTLPRSLIRWSHAAAPWTASPNTSRSQTRHDTRDLHTTQHTPHTHPVLGVFEADILHHDDRRGDFPTGREIERQSLLTENMHWLDTLDCKTPRYSGIVMVHYRRHLQTKAPDCNFYKPQIYPD